MSERLYCPTPTICRWPNCTCQTQAYNKRAATPAITVRLEDAQIVTLLTDTLHELREIHALLRNISERAS